MAPFQVSVCGSVAQLPLYLYEAPQSEPMVEEVAHFVVPRSRERETGMVKGVNIPFKDRLQMTYLLSTRTSLLNPGTGPTQRSLFKYVTLCFNFTGLTKILKLLPGYFFLL